MRPELRLDLVIALVALLLHGVLVVLAPEIDGALPIVTGTVLVLLLPGYALQAALFTPGSLGRLERVLLSVGLSVAVAIGGGLLLNFTEPGLNRQTWFVLLAGVTGAGLVCAALRTRTGSSGFAMSWPRPAHALSASVAIGVLVSAFALASAGASESRDGFTQFWMRPVDGSATATGRLSIGVESHELEPEMFHVEVRADDALIARLPSVELVPGQTWSAEVDAPGGGAAVEAVLFRDGVEAPYRRVRLAAPESGD